MKYARFKDGAGSTRTGVVSNGEIQAAGRTYSFDDVDVLPPCTPSKIVCVGRNYAKHAEELGNEVPDRPLLFFKTPNTLAGHGDVIPLPNDEHRIDHEAELAVVIGEQCRNVSRAEATDVIKGYTCMNDISNRDEQDNETNWVRGKGFDSSAPLGSVLATPDELPDDATVRTFVNGEVKQDGSIEQLIFSIPELIAEITTYLTLEPGDVIATGTPNGVGPLSPGDAVSIEVEGVGTLENTITI